MVEDMTEALNKIIYVRERRPNGTLRIGLDFKNCPTMCEQHTAHLTDINYLIEKYKPDELAHYMLQRNQYRQEILGHDFSRELTLQEAKNVVYESRQTFEKLPTELTSQFKNHLEFLKFIDNPANAEKLIKLGLIKQKEVEKLLPAETPQDQIRTPTQEKDVKNPS